MLQTVGAQTIRQCLLPPTPTHWKECWILSEGTFGARSQRSPPSNNGRDSKRGLQPVMWKSGQLTNLSACRGGKFCKDGVYLGSNRQWFLYQTSLSIKRCWLPAPVVARGHAGLEHWHSLIWKSFDTEITLLQNFGGSSKICCVIPKVQIMALHTK